MTTNVQAYGNRIGIIPKIEMETDWGFKLPDNTNDPAIMKSCETLEGTIFALGPKVEPELGLKVGDEVLFFNHNRNKAIVDEQLYMFMLADELIGVLEIKDD